ncbi:hypothetical protein IFR04_012967 [Cadophora malorum]|uniref:Uncharacterized protein n=1 Tax=Cadophora malorum TaxID=108018 RepID=A0A8H7T668_9HELO|nr:hypothetical protein IFR04_012967 [Cadophora malorum]
MEPLSGKCRGREESGSETSHTTASTLDPAERSLEILPALCDARTGSDCNTPVSSPKRKSEETFEGQRAWLQKRSKSDPLQPCTTAPSPTCTAPRNERDRVPVITGRVHKGDRRTSTGTIDELLILDKRLKHLETHLDDWKEVNMFATELIGTTKVKDQRVEYLRSRTTQRDIRTAITAGEHKKSKITEELNKIPYDIGPSIWFILPTLREERENAYYALLAHPYIAQKTASSVTGLKKKLKQEIINFFDKSFTYQIAAMHRVPVLLTGPLLRLGGDTLFRATDGLNTGGENYRQLDDYNQKLWQEIVSQDVGILSRNVRNQSCQMRSRGESSISSLGLTGLFLGDNQESEYDEGGEANIEVMSPFPKYRKLRRDSGADLGSPPNTSESESNESFYDPYGEEDSRIKMTVMNS